MNIFTRELKANVKSLLIWGGIVILFVSIGMTKFSAYEGNPEMLEILDSMPQALLSAFQLNAFNLTTVEGFLGLMFTFYGLLVTVSAVMLGSDIISKEERDKTVEFSLAMPITRGKLITAKTLAAVVHCICLLGITWAASLVSVAKYNPDSEFYNFLRLSMLALFIMQMIFLAVGIFLGCAMRHYKRAGSTAVSLLLGTYFISVIVSLNDKLEFLKYFSPFTYFSPAMLMNESKIDPNYVLLSLAIIAVCILGGHVIYERRDLYI